MIRMLPFAFYLLMVGFHQVILKDATELFGVSINLPVLLVLAVAVYKSEITSAWFALAVGIVLGTGFPEGMGWHSLTLALIALAAFHLRQRLNLDSMNAKLAIVSGGCLVHNILSVFIERTDGYTLDLWRIMFLGVIYTTFVAWLFFATKEGQITYKKIRAIF